MEDLNLGSLESLTVGHDAAHPDFTRTFRDTHQLVRFGKSQFIRTQNDTR